MVDTYESLKHCLRCWLQRWKSRRIERLNLTIDRGIRAESTSESMQLRDHPLMVRKSGFKTWPPLWTTTHHDQNDKPTGEIGTLEQVIVHELLDNKIFLFILFQSFRYMGFMSFDDLAFCSQIHTLLQAHIGQTIKEIGDIDLSYTL
jgi:hypothetical protein